MTSVQSRPFTATASSAKSAKEWGVLPALPKIPYLRLRVTLVAREKARLPPYKGSLLRGAFGHALRRTTCAMGTERPCESCSVCDKCVYGRLFESRQAFVAGRPSAVRPFVIEPHDLNQSYRPGDPLLFDLLLFGNAVELQPFVVRACESLARHGLGFRRARFELVRVAYQEFDGVWKTGFELGVRLWAVEAPALVPADEPLPSDRLTLHFKTPTRIKRGGRLVRCFDFHLLASRMLQRVLELAELAAGLEGAGSSFDVEAFLERAALVDIADSRIHWHDWQRYSNRQGAKMKLGGVIGELDLEGDIAPFSALLRAAEIAHVGKGATFGLGWIAVG